VKSWNLIPLVLIAAPMWATEQHAATGMVLSVDRTRHSFVASCQAISGYMEAMSMPFEVREPKELDGLAPGTVIDFTLVVDKNTSYAEHVKVHPYVSAEQDPWLARQLKLLRNLSNENKPAAKPLEIGSAVPNFTLTDQAHRQVSFTQFS
jgi:protein SCO1